MADDLPEIQFQLPSADTSPWDEAPPPLHGDGLPEISFDLSFLDQRETIPAAATAMQIRQQEYDLHEGFRQRAAELARRATERSDSGADRSDFLPVSPIIPVKR